MHIIWLELALHVYVMLRQVRVTQNQYKSIK